MHGDDPDDGFCARKVSSGGVLWVARRFPSGWACARDYFGAGGEMMTLAEGPDQNYRPRGRVFGWRASIDAVGDCIS